MRNTYGPRNYVLGAALLVYIGLFALAALVEPLRPDFLDRAHDFANAALLSIGVRAGMPVFEGQDDLEFKQAGRCPIVIGHTPDGGRRALYNSLDQCRPQPFRWTADRLHVTMQRSLDAVRQAPSPESQRKFLQVIADYYCHSPQIANDDISEVSILWMLVRKSYRTGELVDAPKLWYHGRCDTGRPSPKPWPSVSDLLRVAS